MKSACDTQYVYENLIMSVTFSRTNPKQQNWIHVIEKQTDTVTVRVGDNENLKKMKQ